MKRAYRKKKNVVEIGKLGFLLPGYNLGSWAIETLAGFVFLLLLQQNFLLVLLFRNGISCGLTPLVYLLGALDFRSKVAIWPYN